jgi:hypothetical protein
VRWISFVPHPGRRLDIREAVQLSRNRQGILVVLLFLATTAYYTRPLVLRLPTAFLAGMGDYVTEATMVAWYARQTLHDPLRLFQAPSTTRTRIPSRTSSRRFSRGSWPSRGSSSPDSRSS